MNAFLYSAAIQWKLDIRSRSLLIACYIVPLLFFLLMGSIFTSVMPEMKDTLIQTMIVMGVSMGSLIGLPPSLAETYGGDVKKVYQANGVPLYAGLAAMFLSAYIHLTIMCMVILFAAPILFDAAVPADLPGFFAGLAVYLAVSCSMGSVLGIGIREQAKLTMAEQALFLPSIMLSGIMFPVSLLPDALEFVGNLFPAAWGYRLMQHGGFCLENLWYLLLVFIVAVCLCAVRMKGLRQS